MNKDALIEAIANIDDEYILDAHAEAPKTKRRARIIKIAAVAAAVCAMGAAIVLPLALRSHDPGIYLHVDNYASYEDYGYFTVGNSGKFDAVEHREIFINKTEKITVLGNEYELEYDKTVRLPRSDVNTRVYSVVGYERAVVYLDKSDNSIVKLINFPYKDWKIPEDFSEYSELMGYLVDGRCDLSQYDLDMTTQFYTYNKNNSGFGSTVGKGFLQIGDIYEDDYQKSVDRVVNRSFYYTNEINGVTAEDHVSFVFNDSGFVFEIIEKGDDLSSLLTDEKIQEITEKTKTFIKESTAKDKQPERIEITGMSSFTFDKKPYIKTRVDLYYQSLDGEYDEYEYEVIADVIMQI